MILDSLTYIIDADNRKLDKEVAGSEKRVDGLGDAMTGAEKRAADMKDKMVTYFKGVGVAIAAAALASKALTAASERAAFVQQVSNTSKALGIAVGDVDAFGKSIELMGGDAQGARDTLTDLSEAMGEAMADAASGRAKSFKTLGVSLTDAQGKAKDTMQVMYDLAGAVEGMGKSEAVFNIKQLGITDNRSVELILKGRQALERMMRTQKERGVVTERDTEQANKYTVAMARFKQANENASASIARVVLPALTWLIDGFSKIVEWMNQHGDFVKGFFIAIGTVIAVVYGPAVAAAAVATWALIAPFLLVGAAIALAAVAFALIYDDIQNFMAGNDSLIGQIAEVFPAIGDIVKAMYNTVAGIFKLLTGDWDGAKEAFAAAGDAIKNVFGAMSSAIIESLNTLFEWLGMGPGAAGKMADGMTGMFTDMAGNIKSVFTSLVGFVQKIWDWITGIYDKSVGMVSGLAGKVGGWLGFGGDDNGAGAAMASASANPLNSTTSQAISNTSSARTETNVSVGAVNVQTQATDAKGISKDVGSELSGQLKSLQTESASGVAR